MRFTTCCLWLHLLISSTKMFIKYIMKHTICSNVGTLTFISNLGNNENNGDENEH